MTLKNLFKVTVVSLGLVLGLTSTKAEDVKTSMLILQKDVPTAMIFVVCEAEKDQGPMVKNGTLYYPESGEWKLDKTTCRDVPIEMYDSQDIDDKLPNPDFSNPMVCSRMGMMEAPRWQDLNPGWFVVKVKCPKKDGTFSK